MKISIVKAANHNHPPAHYGIRDDEVIVTILLHDVCEDCDISLQEFPVSDAVRHSVDLVTFSIMNGESKEIAKNRYYKYDPADPRGNIDKADRPLP